LVTDRVGTTVELDADHRRHAIGLGARGELVVAKTLRRTLLALPGRITRSARRLILHLPAGWPWAAWLALALARLRCVAYAL
jgi:hypothetical protein